MFKHIYTCRYLRVYMATIEELFLWKHSLETCENNEMFITCLASNPETQEVEEPGAEPAAEASAACLAPALVRIPQTNSLHSMCENQQFVSFLGLQEAHFYQSQHIFGDLWRKCIALLVLEHDPCHILESRKQRLLQMKCLQLRLLFLGFILVTWDNFMCKQNSSKRLLGLNCDTYNNYTNCICVGKATELDSCRSGGRRA